MPDTSPILGLPLIQPAQAQKHVTHNEALRVLDVLVQPVVASRGANVPPASPAEGERHIVGAAPTGAWAGQAQAVAQFEAGQWAFLTPQAGWRVHVLAEDGEAIFSGGLWEGAAERDLRAASLGVNAAPDAFNRLTVSGAASLLTHAGTGGHQMKLNKAAAGDTASLLFQTGFSGRAEMGTTGDDGFTVKVSADGAVWRDGLRVAAATGIAEAPQGLALPGGSAAAPGLAVLGDANTGVAAPAADTLVLAAGGIAALTATAAALTSAVPVALAPGNASAPGLAFAADGDTGFFRPAADQIGLATGGTQRALLTTSALTVSVPVQGTAVTQSATDATAGRLLKVADFGLGGTTGDVSADATGLVTRFVRFSADASSPDGSRWHGLHIGRVAEGQSAQIAVREPGTGGVVAARNRDAAGVWGPWNVLWGRSNALGTVSQAAGVPTGALVERGSNANGEYVRFADGTQICTRSVSASLAIDVAFVGGFRTAAQVWTFPAAFAAAPVVEVGARALTAFGGITTAIPGTTSVSWALTAVTTQTAATREAALAAIGRWF